MSDNLELFSEPETIAMSDAESFELQTESTVESVIESSESQSETVEEPITAQNGTFF